MKHFFKVFFIALLCFILMIGAGFYTYVKFVNTDHIDDYTDVDVDMGSNIIDDNSNNIDKKTPFDIAVEKGDRINILLLGLEGRRTDTIMLVSFDRKTSKADIISIPRDTYFYRAGYENPGDKKINAVYSKTEERGVMAVAENILDMPIDNYISVDYDGVREAVDIIGGVEVNVPFHMEYEDPYAKPPLVIDIPKGKQIVGGDKALEYLRFRHNNDMTVGYPDGDLGRIKAQQDFIKSAVKKILSFKLPVVATEVYPYIKTDLKLADVLLLVGDVINFSTDNIEMNVLPGRPQYIDDISFYVHDPEMVKAMVYEIYGVELEQ